MHLIERAVGSLNELQQQIFIMRFEEDMKPGEIGKELGKTSNAISQQLVRITHQLRKFIERYESERRGGPVS